VDPWCGGHESPVHEVTLAPFFLAKFETTQEQWLRLTGETPSQTGVRRTADEPIALLPVNTVNQRRCREVLDVHGLLLPTEAQWEYGARGGTSSVWWFGDDPADTARAGNVMDRCYLERTRQNVADPLPRRLDDGWADVAPVGSFAANGFGLFDTIGNVLELTLCEPFSYGHPVRAGDGLRLPLPEAPSRGSHCAIRGGDWGSPPAACRSAARTGGTVETSGIEIGVRAARRVEE
jgi:formylglycine-generating enzyme required for sulfatase activity